MEEIRENKIPRISDSSERMKMTALTAAIEHDVSTAAFFSRQSRRSSATKRNGRHKWSGVESISSLPLSRLLHCDSQYRNPALLPPVPNAPVNFPLTLLTFEPKEKGEKSRQKTANYKQTTATKIVRWKQIFGVSGEKERMTRDLRICFRCLSARLGGWCVFFFWRIEINSLKR